MATVEARVAAWLGVVAELLREPLTTLPSEDISQHLLDTFGTEVVSFNGGPAEGQIGLTALAKTRGSAPARPSTRRAPGPCRCSRKGCWTIIRWSAGPVVAVTGDPAADTGGRVPDAIAASERVGTSSSRAAYSPPSPLCGTRATCWPIYRKLPARDRLGAVRVAEGAGVRQRRTTH